MQVLEWYGNIVFQNVISTKRCNYLERINIILLQIHFQNGLEQLYDQWKTEIYIWKMHKLNFPLN